MRPKTTGIGSLPYSAMDGAWRHVRAEYDLSFTPQVAAGDGDGGMLALVLPANLAKRERSGFGVALTDLIEDSSLKNGFSTTKGVEGVGAVQSAQALAKSIKESDHPLAPLKTQIMGPVSLLQALRDAASRPLWSAPELHSKVLDWCIAVSLSIVEKLQDSSTDLVFWLDEPMLGLIEDENEKTKAFELIRQWQQKMAMGGIQTGLHCCSQPPFDLLNTVELDFFSFDALRFPQEVVEGTAPMAAFVENGGIIAVGVIPPLALEGDRDPTDFLRQLCASVNLDSIEKISKQLLLTPTCGTMLTPVSREKEIAKTLREWATALANNWNES